ncbi:hypothetical protein ROHU_021770 [Labeo rohita]|uniref:Uncharacterized protein n=1 Tax=Labeo rohita TaxID=84645 RepID=A0A498MW80_LABRO|nr:hypothetical protein ROHU_013305 [Labeo rohita]RXN25030.1 hypothetical protein ROHU_021770 [Labeo rohita]
MYAVLLNIKIHLVQEITTYKSLLENQGNNPRGQSQGGASKDFISPMDPTLAHLVDLSPPEVPTLAHLVDLNPPVVLSPAQLVEQHPK